VSRTSVAADKRRIRIALTPEGEAMLKDAPTIAAVSQFLAQADLATLAASEEIVVGR